MMGHFGRCNALRGPPWGIKSILGGLSLYLSQLIAQQLVISYLQFRTLLFGFLLVKFGHKTP